MEPDITFLVSYRCPRCQAHLEATGADPDSWLRCPKCGRSSLPPTSPHPVVSKRASEGEVLFIGASDDVRTIPTAPAGSPSAAVSGGGVRRVLFVTGLLVSSLFLVFSLLDQNNLVAGISGLGALVFLGLLAIPPKRR